MSVMKGALISSLVIATSAIITKEDSMILDIEKKLEFGSADFTKEVVEELSPVYDTSVNVTSLPITDSQILDGTPAASAPASGVASFLSKVVDVTAAAIPALSSIAQISAEGESVVVVDSTGQTIFADSEVGKAPSFVQVAATPTVVTTDDSKLMDPIKVPAYRLTMGILSASGLPELEGLNDYSDIFIKLFIKDNAGNTLGAFGSRGNAVDGNAQFQPLNYDDNYIELRSSEDLPAGLRLYVEVWDRDGTESQDDLIGVAKVESGNQCNGLPYEDFIKKGTKKPVTVRNWTKFGTGVSKSNQTKGPVTFDAFVLEVDAVQTCKRDIPLATKKGKLTLFARADVGVPKGQTLPEKEEAPPTSENNSEKPPVAGANQKSVDYFFGDSAAEMSLGFTALALGVSMLRM